MIGVGSVFEAFLRGELEDDDEVTLIHASADSGYRLASEALVNIRATLAHAEAAGLLDGGETQALVAHAKSTFYPDRNYTDLGKYAARILPEERAQRFAEWVRQAPNWVDVKRQDALELIRRLLGFRHEHPGRGHVDWSFHHTDAWEQVRHMFLGAGGARGATRPEIEEIRADPRLYEELLTRANLRAARAELGRRDGFVPATEDLTMRVSALAARHGLSDAASLRAWMLQRRVDARELERLVRDEAYADNAELIRASREESALADYLLMRAPRGQAGRTGVGRNGNPPAPGLEHALAEHGPPDNRGVP